MTRPGEGLYVVVSGSPGSGKTTLATGLAGALGLPLITKDAIKEALLASLGAATAEESQRLGHAAIAALLAVARENGCGVLDSVWRRSLATGPLLELGGRVVEVHCACDPGVARARHAARRRHPGHFDSERASDDELWFGEAAQPIAGGWPVIAIDTGLAVDLDVLASAVRCSAG